MTGRVLYRPIGGWNARRWRRDVLAWLAFAMLYVTAGSTLVGLYGLLSVVIP